MGANPYAEPKVKQSILERETQRAIDNLRRAAQKIIDDFEIPMPKAMEFMASLGPIDEIAPDSVKGHDYLDKLTKLCRDECLKTIPPSTKKPPVDESKPHIIGYGADRHIDTGAIQMPVAGPKQQSLKADDEPAEVKVPKTVLGNPITEDTTPAEVTPEIKAKLDAIKAAAKTPDLSDVTKLKEAAKVSFEADELGGSDTIIPAEVIEEKPTNEADEFFGEKRPTEPYKPLGQRVAEMLTDAFPEATPDWKTHFFREATGFSTVARGEAEAGSATIIESLKEAIEESKNKPVLESATKEPEISTISNSQPTTPEINNSPIAPKNQAANEASNQPSALAVIQKSEITPAPKTAVGFRMPSQEQFSYMQQLAKFVADSGYYKDVNTPAKAMVIMMKGYSLDIEPMTALDGIFVINGRPFVGAKLVKGLLEDKGKCQRFDVIGDARQCTVTIQRKGRAEPNVFKFTWDDAVKAQLVGKDNWQKYPVQMLRWRAIKQAVDTEFPELSFGLGRDDDEIDDAA